jgi:hypothetical protein
MDILLAELMSIPNKHIAKQHSEVINISEYRQYGIKKYRFVKILQSVNPNFTLQYTENELQICIDGKVYGNVFIYTDISNKPLLYMNDIDYYIKLETKYCGPSHRFNNQLIPNLSYAGFYDIFYYDSKYIEDLLSRYYTNAEFIEKLPTMLIAVMPKDLLNMIYVYLTSSMIFN